MPRLSLFRITDARYEREAFSGVGGLYASGRWHDQGIRVVYAARTSSLALLEWRVHTGALLLDRTYVLIEATVPDHAVRHLDADALPPGWDQTPPPPSTRAFGMAFLRRAELLALSLPSAVNPLERNLLLNPAHSDAALIEVVRVQPLRVDPRLFGSDPPTP